MCAMRNEREFTHMRYTAATCDPNNFKVSQTDPFPGCRPCGHLSHTCVMSPFAVPETAVSFRILIAHLVELTE